jgi:glycosyltransferase involved in cell wall biosynthesis
LPNAVPNSDGPKTTRIAVLNSHPIQYFAPLYAYLNATPDLDVTALYLSDFSMRAFCSEHRLNNVVFTGFVNQSDLPGLYAALDIFVLPSEHEPWGLAVNEAMCAGLPVVVSQGVGCVADLVRDGVNGYTPAAGDIGGLARALQRLIEDEDLRERQGRASLTRIQQWVRSALAGLQPRSTRLPPCYA